MLDFLDKFNFIDRIAGLLMALEQGQMGKQIRVLHTPPGKDGRTPQNRTGNYYAKLLKRYGIPVWWRRATSKYLIFNVRVDQWQWAVDLLTKEGVPVEHKARPWTGKAGKMPEPWEIKTAVKR